LGTIQEAAVTRVTEQPKGDGARDMGNTSGPVYVRTRERKVAAEIGEICGHHALRTRFRRTIMEDRARVGRNFYNSLPLPFRPMGAEESAIFYDENLSVRLDRRLETGCPP
jgi:hypothetical protein